MYFKKILEKQTSKKQTSSTKYQQTNRSTKTKQNKTKQNGIRWIHKKNRDNNYLKLRAERNLLFTSSGA